MLPIELHAYPGVQIPIESECHFRGAGAKSSGIGQLDTRPRARWKNPKNIIAHHQPGNAPDQLPGTGVSERMKRLIGAQRRYRRAVSHPLLSGQQISGHEIKSIERDIASELETRPGDSGPQLLL